jgi:integrase/recombinase XerD
MRDFRQYLRDAGISRTTAESYHYFIEKQFKLYLHSAGLQPEQLSYGHLLEYINQRKSTGKSPKTINLELCKISYYLEFLEVPNIAESLRVKGVQRHIPHDLFTEKQLDSIYNNFPHSRNAWTHEDTLKRFHIILGLKIYQAIQTAELQKLELQHLKPEAGKIYIPSTARTNKRTLDLKPFQVLPLHEYIRTERQKLYTESKLEDDNRVFPKARLKRGMPVIKNMINRYQPGLKSLYQIRASVITNWLRHYNLRQVQYMAGHKYVSSTEYYRTDTLENLQKDIGKYHPLR